MEQLVIIWLLCSVVGAIVGNSKGRGAEGAILGLVLGFFGVIITIFLPAKGDK